MDSANIEGAKVAILAKLQEIAACEKGHGFPYEGVDPKIFIYGYSPREIEIAVNQLVAEKKLYCRLSMDPGSVTRLGLHTPETLEELERRFLGCKRPA